MITSSFVHEAIYFTDAPLQTRSLRALRKLLLAFRSAARMNDEEENTSAGGWKIEESSGLSFAIYFEERTLELM